MRQRQSAAKSQSANLIKFNLGQVELCYPCDCTCMSMADDQSCLMGWPYRVCFELYTYLKFQ